MKVRFPVFPYIVVAVLGVLGFASYELASHESTPTCQSVLAEEISSLGEKGYIPAQKQSGPGFEMFSFLDPTTGKMEIRLFAIDKLLPDAIEAGFRKYGECTIPVEDGDDIGVHTFRLSSTDGAVEAGK